MEHSDDDFFGQDHAFPQHQTFAANAAWGRHPGRPFTEPKEGMKYAIFTFTLVCILVVQFRGTLTVWIRRFRQRFGGIQGGFVEVLWSLCNVPIEFIEAATEMARLLINSNAALDSDLRPAPRRMVMPDLDDVSDEETTSNGGDDTAARQNESDLEPAFLREEDYPQGWMVYCPGVGVILKTEADKLQQKLNTYITEQEGVEQEGAEQEGVEQEGVEQESAEQDGAKENPVSCDPAMTSSATSGEG